MAGKGPRPKDPARRVRQNSDPMGIRVVQVQPVSQPELVDVIGENNPVTEMPWTRPTLRLWAELGEFPTTDYLLPAQWSLLARAMILDDALISGSAKMAIEARLQLQKFGIAPDDVARLRIMFAEADVADEKRTRKPVSARKRYGTLTSVPDASAG